MMIEKGFTGINDYAQVTDTANEMDQASCRIEVCDYQCLACQRFHMNHACIKIKLFITLCACAYEMYRQAVRLATL
jgi:hypothetical protein